MGGGSNFRARVFDPAKKRAQLEEMIFTTLRHTYASLLIASGVQPMVVAEQLGHTDARLVLQRYGHLYPGAAAQAAMALDLYLKAAVRRIGWRRRRGVVSADGYRWAEPSIARTGRWS
jgi:integrase